jgi:integrase
MGNRGAVFAASKSSVGIRFRYRGTLCEERIKLPPTPRNLNYARNLRGKILAEIAKGTFDYYAFFPESKRSIELAKEPAAMVTVGKKLDDWIAGQARALQKSTLLGYERAIKHTLKPAFGALLLRDVTRDVIRKWISGQAASAKRLNNLLTPLRTMLAEALTDGAIAVDPMRDISIKQRGPRDDEIDPFTPDEISAILGSVEGQIRNLLQFAFWSGLRTSELIALRWQDVDWVKGVILVRQARVAGELKGPKTKAGKRDVKLLPAARAALQAQREHSQLRGAYVFLDPRTGLPWGGDKPIREWHWRPALQRAGVRYRYPYQTRHTYASTLLSAGENPVWVAGQMGHRDWVMIVRTYGRWIPDVDPTAGDKAAAIGGNSVGHCA